MTTYSSPVPPRSDGLGWAATGLLVVPAGIAAAWGIFRLVTAGSLPGHGIPVTNVDYIQPAALSVDPVFLIIWTGTLNLLLAGLVIGVPRLRGLDGNPWLGSAGLFVGGIVGAVATFWAWSNGPSWPVSGLIMLAGAIIAIGSALSLLRPWQKQDARSAG